MRSEYGYKDGRTGEAHLDWLSCDLIDGTCRAHLELIQDHVAQSLVIDHSDIDVGSELLACDSGIHGLIAVIVISGGEKLISKVRNCGVFLRESGTWLFRNNDRRMERR
jgi:hypothetical protein